MEVTVVRAGYDDKTILRNLMQLYLYDFTDFKPFDVNSHGLFEYGYLDNYWTEAERRHPFLIRVDGQLAGFVLIHDYPDLEERPAHVISEFFVLRRYRRQRVGERAAHHVFDLLPGPWEVSEIPSNESGIAFWRRIIGRYTNGRFEERTADGRILQLFDNTRH